MPWPSGSSTYALCVMPWLPRTRIFALPVPPLSTTRRTPSTTIPVSAVQSG